LSARLDVKDTEIREVAIDQFKKMQMERYIPISYLSELALILSYSTEPPKEFILSLEDSIRSHLNLVPDNVWSLLEPSFGQLSMFIVFLFFGLLFFC
jgi:hypothetical protein